MTAQVRCYWGSECTPDFANDTVEVTVNDNDDGLPSSPPGLRLGRLEGEPRLAVRWDEVPEATGSKYTGARPGSRRGEPCG